MITDDEILATYEQYPFAQIEQRLAAVNDALLAAPTDVTATVIQASAINSIISIGTHVSVHERATHAVWELLFETEAPTIDEIRDALDRSVDGNHVMYYNNKAEWIYTNLLGVDWVELAADYQAERWQRCQQRLVDKADGIGTVKAGFTLANLGITDAVCIDSIMRRAFEIGDHERFDASNPFGTTVVETYYERVETLRAETPRASEQLPRYIWQWAAWSATRRDGFVPHDPWFLLLDTLLEADSFAPVGNTETDTVLPDP